MSDFCNQCDAELGGLSKIANPGGIAHVICECCGPTMVDYDGNCRAPHCRCGSEPEGFSKEYCMGGKFSHSAIWELPPVCICFGLWNSACRFPHGGTGTE